MANENYIEDLKLDIVDSKIESQRENAKKDLEADLKALSEEGLSSTEIARIISEQEGKSISPSGVGYRQEEIYDDNGLERPKVVSKSNIKLPEDEVCELRREGYSYRAIALIMKEKYGIEITGSTVRTKCKKFFEKVLDRKEQL